MIPDWLYWSFIGLMISMVGYSMMAGIGDIRRHRRQREANRLEERQITACVLETLRTRAKDRPDV